MNVLDYFKPDRVVHWRSHLSENRPISYASSLGNETVEEVKEYKYLLQMASAGPINVVVFLRRVGIGWSALAATPKE